MRKIPSKSNSVVQSSYVGFPGELTVDPDTFSLKVHDGSTTGGISIIPSALTTDILKIKEVKEVFTTKTGATGVVAHDCSTGHIFYHSSISANFTANLTNLSLDSGYATTVTMVLIQGATAYIPTALQIGGVGQTLSWQGGSAPSGNSNKTDVVAFSIINNSDTYKILAQLVSFG